MSPSEVELEEPFAGRAVPPAIRRIAAALLPSFYDELEHVA